MVFDIVEECFSIQMWAPEKTNKADAIIDEAANFQDAMLIKINKAKTKADFRPISEELETAAMGFITKLNGLN